MKLPSFLFYPADFVMGTAAMTNAEVGTYTLFLCHQWDHGCIPDDPQQLAIIGRCKRSMAIKIAQAKFPRCADGKCRNSRLEHEREKASKAHAQRCQASRHAASSRTARPPGDAPPDDRTVNRSVDRPATKSESESESDVQARERDVEFPPDFPKTAEASKAACATIGCPEAFAVSTWNKAAGRGGHDAKDVPIRNWAFYLASQWSYEQNRLAQASRSAASGASPANSGATTADKITHQKEYDRLLERMRVIKGQYDAYQSWSDEDRIEWKKLSRRKEQLKTILGITV